MKKILLLLLPFVAAGLVTRAQTINYGVKGGLSMSASSTTSDKYRASFYGGGFAEFKLNKHWSLQPELLYYNTGENKNYRVQAPNNAVFYDIVKTRQNYLSIPLMVKYYITPKLYVETGPEVSMLLDSKVLTFGEWHNTNNSYKRFNLGVSAGVGYKLPFGLGVSARYTQGVTEPSPVSISCNSNLRVGIDYTFKKK